MALLICSCRLGGFDKINIAENALNLNCIKDKALCSFCFIGYDFGGSRCLSFGTGMKSSKISFVSRDGAEELIPFVNDGMIPVHNQYM